MSAVDQPAKPDGVDEQRAIQEQPVAVTKQESEQQRAATEFSKDKSVRLNMRVQVYSPFRDYFDGTAFSLSAENATGPFDILPRHHNFISLLVPCDLVIRTVDEGEHKIQISGGIIHVKADQVIVFLDV